MKFDGYRALAFKAGKEVRLFSRNRTNFNDNYPQLVDALKSLRPKTSSSTARSLRWTTTAGSFQLLQSYALRKGIPLVYYALDLLRLDGTDLRSRALIERREQLAKLLKKPPAGHSSVLHSS